MYLVKVSTHKPYLIDREYRKKASNYHTAIARAIREFRADERFKGKVLKDILVYATRV